MVGGKIYIFGLYFPNLIRVQISIKEGLSFNSDALLYGVKSGVTKDPCLLNCIRGLLITFDHLIACTTLEN